MTLAELMTGLTPSPSYEGFSTADDMVLAVNFDGVSEDPNDWYVAETGISEHSGALNPQLATSQYIRTGEVETKTGTKLVITVNGDRYNGDEFQDMALAHSMKYGTGSAVVKDFVYFDSLTGKGEKGKATISVDTFPGNGAGSNASFGLTLSSQKRPEEYTYAPPTP